MRRAPEQPDLFGSNPLPLYALRITLEYVRTRIVLDWFRPPRAERIAACSVSLTPGGDLLWRWEEGRKTPAKITQTRPAIVRQEVQALRDAFNVPPDAVLIEGTDGTANSTGFTVGACPIFLDPGESPWFWLEDEIQLLVQAQRTLMAGGDDPDRALRREMRKMQKAAAEAERLAALRRSAAARQRPQRTRPVQQKEKPVAAPAVTDMPALPRPAVSVRFDVRLAACDQAADAPTDLRSYFLEERASLWWISNQSDDLLGLPYCNIQRLEYQLRTALRVLGPLRGRALLSDEVGLGKTIEAGLVLKEYLTRGMVKRFLILTVPSLVDQWEEELQEKFSISAATTNQNMFRQEPDKFWQEHSGIVASLHTVKQAAHLAAAQAVHWDMLVVDEAHYLRNRNSLAWQAVNALPRQFLLLLTATPVQNSLEELYNLVTLLQPGQLPSPKEFRERFMDKENPQRPRQPEELRRLLRQVMIRNTRANAGVSLPPRRAETVLFDAAPEERAFWEQWEAELRTKLAGLTAHQASLWGRLLLQAVGSSPAAWREALLSFPDHEAAGAWSQTAPLEKSWQKKCELVLPLAQCENGVVIFTQFLRTQAELAAYLDKHGRPNFVINGQTPAEQRQPITEEFRRRGGALLLTHSGTEGRNLQFCHRLVNFDLPWNPMEIEQRIGRLHRLGQQQPVRIYNFVQAGTLQEHLLQILQEKLNLFELVVGETGLILGERFTSEEFAQEIFRRWRESEGRVAESLQSLGEHLAAARDEYAQVKQIDETLFAKDYESV